ncbi:MAG: hypothetical protein P8P56_12405 [Yoonia sp.]|nr:hypothetical protein [Yoonia sp.]
MIDDPAGEARCMIDYLDLAWADGVLNYAALDFIATAAIAVDLSL